MAKILTRERAERVLLSLTFSELAGLWRASRHGQDPTGLAGYGKAHELYTEDGGRRMHPVASCVLDDLILDKLNEVRG